MDGPNTRTTAVELSTKPTEPPIACTLEADALPDRLAAWQAVLDRAGPRTTTATGALRVELGQEADLGEVTQLVVAEQQCCAFFSFAITVDERGIALEVSAPDGATELVVSLFGSPSVTPPGG